MKKIVIVAAGFVFIPGVVMAQSREPVIKPDSLNNNSFHNDARLVTFSQMDQRKIYHWGNGQRSTATGREAGELSSGYVLVLGDSAVVVGGPYWKRH